MHKRKFYYEIILSLIFNFVNGGMSGRAPGGNSDFTLNNGKLVSAFFNQSFFRIFYSAFFTQRFSGFNEAVSSVDTAVNDILKSNANIRMEQVIQARNINNFLKTINN